jgi:F-type H+-transporting ATPase subunit delta
MKNLALVKKYAHGLVLAVKDEPEYDSVSTEVRAFLDLLESREDLRQALVSPFVHVRKKKAVLDEVLALLKAGGKASRFVRLLLAHKRLDLLGAIVDALPEAWSERLGIVTYEVTSAVALTPAQRKRLAAGLEASEGRPVRLVERTDPEIVGGLAVRKGHIVYDASVEGRLAALRERLGQD